MKNTNYLKITNFCHFKLNDNDTDFKLECSEVLKCLIYASEQGKLPKIDALRKAEYEEIIEEYEFEDQNDDPFEDEEDEDESDNDKELEFNKEFNYAVFKDAALEYECEECHGKSYCFIFEDLIHTFFISMETIVVLLSVMADHKMLKEPCQDFWLEVSMQFPSLIPILRKHL